MENCTWNHEIISNFQKIICFARYTKLPRITLKITVLQLRVQLVIVIIFTQYNI